MTVPKLQEIIEKEGIEKKFKLSTSISTNNYVLFDHRGVIRKYQNEAEILHEFFGLRKTLYERRKEYLLAKLRKEFETISNKVRFILAVINEEIKINKVKRKLVLLKLREMGFSMHSELDEILPEKKKLTVVSEKPEEAME